MGGGLDARGFGDGHARENRWKKAKAKPLEDEERGLLEDEKVAVLGVLSRLVSFGRARLWIASSRLRIARTSGPEDVVVLSPRCSFVFVRDSSLRSRTHVVVEESWAKRNDWTWGLARSFFLAQGPLPPGLL